LGRVTDRYDLTLFISGASDLSARAVADARHLCDAHLGGRCDLSVVDLHDDAGSGLHSHVLATPTLVRTGPPPTRRIVGDLSDSGKVLLALDLVP
jgi:circadian clock protein KaiB